MNGYLKRQFLHQNRGHPLANRRTEDALYEGCLPQASGTRAHPLTQVRHLASQGPCWDGYHRDYSKKKYSNDSCVKDGKKKKKDKKDKKKEGGDSSSSSSSDDEDGKPKKKKAKKEDK